MMKATLPLGLTLFLAAAGLAYAQAPGTETGVNEAVMRQAYRISLQQKLREASLAEQQKDTARAAKLYDDAWELVQKTGYINVPAEAEQARAGLAAVRLGYVSQVFGYLFPHGLPAMCSRARHRA